MLKRFCLLIFAVIIGNAATVFAAPEIIEASGSYVMDSLLDETLAAGTARAREEAKVAAVEKAGVYVKSYAVMKNLELDYDEVRTVSAQLLQIQDEKRSVEVVEENLIKITVTIQALVEVDNDAVLKEIMRDRQALEESARQYSELQKEYEALKREMAELKARYGAATDEQKAELKKSAEQNAERFSAAQELEAGNRFYLLAEYSAALECYNRAAALNPDSAEIYNNRGLAHYHLNQLEKAVADFSRAVEINSAFARAYNNRGIARHAAGHVELAILDYTKALALEPRFGYALNNRGNAYAAAGQNQNAVADLQAAAEILSNRAEVRNNLGSAYLLVKNFEAAVREYTAAINLDAQFAEAYYNRSVARYNQGKFAEALPDAQKALELKPADADAQALLKLISGKLGR